MFQKSFLINFVNIKPIIKSWKLICLILILFTISSSYSATVTTLSSSNSHHFELLSNNSYRNFFLRQYFIELLNISNSSLIQSMIANHHLTPKLEQSLYLNTSFFF